MKNSWLVDCEKELEGLKAGDMYRSLKVQENVDGPYAAIEGKKCLLMASNNYLGLTGHPEVIAAAEDALLCWGTGSGGSRLTTGTFRLHGELEEELALFKGEEQALVFGTGYMANLGVIQALAGPEDLILSDALNHASIVDGCRLSRARTCVYRHRDMTHLEKLLKEEGARRKIIVTDGVFSMDGDIAPLPDILELAVRHNALVLLDDAHATGVIGKNGAGTAEYFGVKGLVGLQVGTLSKALASMGAFVTGSRVIIEYLKNKARSFIFSTAPPPAAVGAALAALRLVRQNTRWPDELTGRARFLREGLQRLGFTVLPGDTPIIPVITGNSGCALDLAGELFRRGVFVPAIRPPSVPPGESRLRVTVTLAHRREDLLLALEAFRAAGEKCGIIRGKE